MVTIHPFHLFPLTCIMCTDLPVMPISACVWIQATDLYCDSPVCCNKRFPLTFKFRLREKHKAQTLGELFDSYFTSSLLAGLNKKFISYGLLGFAGQTCKPGVQLLMAVISVSTRHRFNTGSAFPVLE